MTTELNKAITEAAEAGVTLLKKSQMALDFTQSHHKEYTRTNDRGTVSHVKGRNCQMKSATRHSSPTARRFSIMSPDRQEGMEGRAPQDFQRD